MVFSDCDCRDVSWDTSGTTGFPMELEVGETASGQIPNVHTMSSTETPTCISSDCSTSVEVLLADGSPLPDFITYNVETDTLIVSPTQSSDEGIYSLLVK